VTESPTILIHTDTPVPAAEAVRRAHPDLTVATCDSYDGLAAALSGSGASVVYTVRFAGTPGFPRAALVENPAVTWVSVGGSGTDHLAPWDAGRLTVTNAAGVAADMMAEYALGAALHFSLGFERFRAAQDRHDWIAGKVAPIEGRTVLIIGLGHTGQAAARRFKAMGLEVLGLRARPEPTPFVDEVHGMDALHTLLSRADLILVCVPLLPTTRGMLDAAAFARTRRGAVLVDVSRGGVVVEAALREALSDGRLAGAALDVFETEPLPPDNPLWDMPNVIVTPHCSSVHDGWQAKSVAMFCENLARFRRGEPLSNIVDPARGY
jgi:phosphoglycerate dehydrogenase-like enzyme